MNGPLILSVEDSDADFSMLEMVLQRCLSTFGLHRATDGEEAVSFLHQLETSVDQPRPNLVLLDVNLPRLDGFEVLQAIKSHLGIAKIPVVMFTSSSDAREKKKALALGAEEFITKPVHLNQMIEILDEICSKYLLNLAEVRS
jgi:two-component system, chemotaxis family, response regulator Rcp1